MQEVSGAYLTDLNGVAQLSSIDMAVNKGLHSFLRKTLTPQIQAYTCSLERRAGTHLLRARPANGFSVRAIQRQDCCRVGSQFLEI